jgi:hypothetical protein
LQGNTQEINAATKKVPHQYQELFFGIFTKIVNYLAKDEEIYTGNGTYSRRRNEKLVVVRQ